MASELPRFILLESVIHPHTVFAYADEFEGIPHSVIIEGKQGMYNPLAKIEIEPSKVDSKYVHLRFCYANKYLSRREIADLNGYVIAASDKPEEDRNKLSCTLFELTKADDDGHVRITHVNTGWSAQFGQMRMVVVSGSQYNWDKFNLVDWNTIVKLPKHVAFKGDNGKYLQAHWKNGHPYLQFSSDDPYDKASGFRVEPRPDGYVRIKSDYFGNYWRQSPRWIWADKSGDDYSFKDLEDAFWPVKIDEDTIALRNGANGRYCKRFTDDLESCLSAKTETTTTEARLKVVELVQERKIHSLIYRMENAQVFDKAPYVAGKTTAYNKGDVETSVEVEIGYEDETTTSFDRGVSISAGVQAKIEAKVPKIATASFEFSLSITGTFMWGTSNTTRKKASAKGIVRVPPRSRVIVTYVGTKGTCNVPFSYTQEDKSSTDGKIVYSKQNDGMYTGTNCYDFDFVVEKAHPI